MADNDQGSADREAPARANARAADFLGSDESDLRWFEAASPASRSSGFTSSTAGSPLPCVVLVGLVGLLLGIVLGRSGRR